jgi:hypothetical protein
MNDLPAAGQRPPLPRLHFEDMPGFRSSPSADDNQEPKTARIGEMGLPSLVRGKSFSVEGRLQATSRLELAQLGQTARRAFGERDALGTWRAIPYAALSDPTVWWEANGRAQAFEPQTRLVGALNDVLGPWQREFVLGIHLLDPRFYWSAGVDSGVVAGSVNVTNLGIAPTDPVLTVTSTGASVTVYDDTRTRKLTFPTPPAGALVIDFAARTALVGAQAVELDIAVSDWWDRGVPGLAPGLTSVRQVGGSDLRVTFRHASW